MSRPFALAFVVGLVGTICAVTPSVAITLTIDGSGTPYTESGFTIDPIRIVNGNCDGASGKPCAALNSGDTSQLSKIGGGTFILTAFGFEFQGNPSILTVTEKNGAATVGTFTYDESFCAKNVWCTVSLNSPLVTAIIFDDTGTGDIRIDDLNITVRGEADPLATPLPGALPLLASGLGVFGYFGFRRKKKTKALTA